MFGECLYIDTGGKPYSTNWGSKLFFLIYWSIQNGWMVFFCGYISFVLFGGHLRALTSQPGPASLGYSTHVCTSVCRTCG